MTRGEVDRGLGKSGRAKVTAERGLLASDGRHQAATRKDLQGFRPGARMTDQSVRPCTAAGDGTFRRSSRSAVGGGQGGGEGRKRSPPAANGSRPGPSSSLTIAGKDRRSEPGVDGPWPAKQARTRAEPVPAAAIHLASRSAPVYQFAFRAGLYAVDLLQAGKAITLPVTW